MPPASKSKGAKTFSRDEKLDQDFQEAIHKSQLYDKNVFMDARLICGDGGLIRAHSTFLQAISPFFSKCFQTQGENYLKSRDISLPDFTLGEIKALLTLLYSGTVNLPCEQDINILRCNLAFFEIDIQDDLSSKKVPTGLTDPSQQPTLKIARQPKKPKEVEPAKEETRKKPKRNYNDSDYEPDTEDEGPPPPKKAGGGTVSESDEEKTEDSAPKKWVEPNYNDKVWFDKEARKCQHCKKKYHGPAEASACITGHTRLRCYFCFIVCTNTENLFEHFKKDHKQAGRENCLLCPYCDLTVAYKSVSCHVISLHLADKKKGQQQQQKDSSFEGSGKKAAIQTTITINAKGTICTTVPYRPRVGLPTTAAVTADSKKNNHVVVLKPMYMFPKPKKDVVEEEDEEEEEEDVEDEEEEEKEEPSKRWKLDPDGMIRMTNLDITIKKRGLDGNIWYWNIKKDNYPIIKEPDIADDQEENDAKDAQSAM